MKFGRSSAVHVIRLLLVPDPEFRHWSRIVDDDAKEVWSRFPFLAKCRLGHLNIRLK